MIGYAARRVLEALVTAWGVVTAVFFLLRLTGDPVALMLPPGSSAATIAAMRTQLGYDRPLWRQYAAYLGDVLTGSFQNSLTHGGSSLSVVLERAPATIALAVGSLIVSIIVGCAVGLIAALRRGRAADTLVLVLTSIAQAMPSFWVGIVLVMLFAVQLGWLPVSGASSPLHFILPITTLTIFSAASIARMFRSSLLTALNQDYVRTAVSKGISNTRTLARHVVPNALLPVITVVGLQAGSLLGGAVVTEVIFAWPGIGQLMVTSIEQRDFPVVQVAILFTAIAFVAVNLLSDLLYGLADPRIRLRTAK